VHHLLLHMASEYELKGTPAASGGQQRHARHVLEVQRDARHMARKEKRGQRTAAQRHADHVMPRIAGFLDDATLVNVQRAYHGEETKATPGNDFADFGFKPFVYDPNTRPFELQTRQIVTPQMPDDIFDFEPFNSNPVKGNSAIAPVTTAITVYRGSIPSIYLQPMGSLKLPFGRNKLIDGRLHRKSQYRRSVTHTFIVRLDMIQDLHKQLDYVYEMYMAYEKCAFMVFVTDEQLLQIDQRDLQLLIPSRHVLGSDTTVNVCIMLSRFPDKTMLKTLQSAILYSHYKYNDLSELYGNRDPSYYSQAAEEVTAQLEFYGFASSKKRSSVWFDFSYCQFDVAGLQRIISWSDKKKVHPLPEVVLVFPLRFAAKLKQLDNDILDQECRHQIIFVHRDAPAVDVNNAPHLCPDAPGTAYANARAPEHFYGPAANEPAFKRPAAYYQSRDIVTVGHTLSYYLEHCKPVIDAHEASIRTRQAKAAQNFHAGRRRVGNESANREKLHQELLGVADYNEELEISALNEALSNWKPPSSGTSGKPQHKSEFERIKRRVYLTTHFS
jgi:hypothetical protein